MPMRRVGSLSAKSCGNVGDIMTMGIFVLAMLTVMFAYMNCYELLHIKGEVSQISRRYILVAETNGYIPEELKDSLLDELKGAGLEDVDITGSTLIKAEYGRNVYVCIKGKIKGKYEISEKRTSTAKY